MQPPSFKFYWNGNASTCATTTVCTSTSAATGRRDQCLKLTQNGQ
jgi:hypothetical protein